MKNLARWSIVLTCVAWSWPVSGAEPKVFSEPFVSSDRVIPAESVELVEVSEKGWSFWDVPGIKQISSFFDQAWSRTRKRAGWSRTESDATTESLMAAETKKDPIKLSAIRYLAGLDWQSYPDVIDTLLASVEDVSEVVRYEALLTLQAKRPAIVCVHQRNGAKDASGRATGCDCVGCQFPRKVVDRLNELLLARDETGGLKEKSERVRTLATEMIESYLASPEGGQRFDVRDAASAESALEASVSGKPMVESLPTDAVALEPESTEASRSFFPRWFKSRRTSETSGPTTMDLKEAKSVLNGASHSVGYRGLAAPMQSVPTAPAIAGERVVIAPPQQTWADPPKKPSRLSQIFGY
jgi:hypothetical protein